MIRHTLWVVETCSPFNKDGEDGWSPCTFVQYQDQHYTSLNFYTAHKYKREIIAYWTTGEFGITLWDAKHFRVRGYGKK